MKKPIAFIFCLLLLLGCENESKLTFENLQLENEPCPDCPKINIAIPKVLDETRIAKAVNTALREEIIAVLRFEEEEEEINTIQKAMSSFARGNHELGQMLGQEVVPWEANFEGKISYEDATLLCIRLKTYSFLGGAHGYNAVTLLNFDKQKGNEIEGHQLFKDYEGFREFAEEKFRIQENIPPNSNINDTGFMFLGNSFDLPQQIGLVKEGVLLQYNHYEVATHDENIVLIIPFKEAKPFLKNSYQKTIL
ncbi:hypothetical protein MTsPCn9_17460 [Croceitalea sp. MTPC9]|uniref:PdaC/SigV domain-containing protein n=1 Tax=unclassified Croceitalea TaxID=2632280 RepID=UPI002B3956AB|nr:hypothetical protein MTsPCn6_10310 [Croceitalea sp. MTPC6]GMN16810.1 hypothetical protein MTsPCn9_17460 [Croceitalea sp. MTPC9]